MLKDDIKSYFSSIKSNIILANELDRKLYNGMNYASFAEAFIKRSYSLRDLLKSNQDTLDSLKNILNKKLTKESAEALYLGYRSLVNDQLHDSYLIINIIDKLVPYYEEKNDYTKLIHLYSDRTLEVSTFLMANKNELERMEKDLYKILSFKKYYRDFELNERMLFYYAYYNLIAYLPEYNEKYYANIIKLYKEAKDFYHSSIVLEMKDQEIARKEFNLLNKVFLHNFMYYLDDGLGSQMEFVDIIDEIKDTFDDEMDRDLGHAVLTYLHDEMDDLELVFYLKNYYTFHLNDAKTLTFNESNDEIYLRCENVVDTANMIFDFMGHSYISKEKKEEICNYVLSCALDFFTKVPKSKYMNSYVEEATSSIVKKALPFIRNVDFKEEVFTTLILKRQSENYLHSKMVEKIALTILDRMNQNRYPLVKDMVEEGFWDYSDLRGFVARGARIHDVGKSLVLGIVNQQIRYLTTDELYQIRLHPLSAFVFIQNDFHFSFYQDIIKGHHKSYDGKSGYPLDFDNTKSKYKLIIDLITIADCIDAGTDIYGRNYHEGKNFDMVYNELKNGASTLYNPDIVAYIGLDNNLMNELKYIVGEYRMELRYDIYVKEK